LYHFAWQSSLKLSSNFTHIRPNKIRAARSSIGKALKFQYKGNFKIFFEFPLTLEQLNDLRSNKETAYSLTIRQKVADAQDENQGGHNNGVFHRHRVGSHTQQKTEELPRNSVAACSVASIIPHTLRTQSGQRRHDRRRQHSGKHH
jgi:hypothetical protein